MLSAIDVADYFLALAASEEEPELMTQLRLQKLLYYAQAWSLTLRGNPIFRDEIQAWTNGPVVRSVWNEFRECGNQPIERVVNKQAPPISQDDSEFIRSIWESYKSLSASGLRHKTHSEAPWLLARGGADVQVRTDNEITHESMIEYFSHVFKERQLGHLSIERYRQSERDFAARRGRLFSEIRKKYVI